MGYEEFHRWYTTGDGSGSGSSPAATTEWRMLVEGSLTPGGTVVDIGCGDWQHSKLIDWGDARYVGIEVVPVLVERLREQFPEREFHLLDPEGGCSGLAGLLDRIIPGGANLAICKDVIQHLSNEESLLLLSAILPRVDRLLLVNDSCNDGNPDIEVGGCRHVDPRVPPYSLDAEEVLRMCGGQKVAFLIKGHKVL